MPFVVSKILGPDGKPYRREVPRAKYDAAGDGVDNRRHWAQADALSALQANSLGIRQKLRQRSRYECANNSYANGLVLTLANDLIGTGPSLQCLLPEDDTATENDAGTPNQQIEQRFAEWAEEIGLARKLRTAKQAKTRDGEAFFLLRTNRKLKNPVKLDIVPIECDRVTSPQGDTDTSTLADGIKFDSDGNPTQYFVLDESPGDVFAFSQDGSWVSAERVIHWFRVDRPGQVRGVPEITPGLQLFAMLRRYTLATVVAAEIAAEFAAVLELPATAAEEGVIDGEPFEELEISRGMMTTTPAGAKLAQFKAEQPVTTYEMFKRELLKEIGRSSNAPFNVVAGDSSLYNYSSARLDHLLYRGALLVERDDCRCEVLYRIIEAWSEEGRLIPGYLPAVPEEIPHTWYWPGFATIDPLKEATADEKNLANCTTTLKELLSESNRDWEQFMRQRAKEINLARELGIPLPGEAKTNSPADQAALDNPAAEDDSPARKTYLQLTRNGHG